MARAIFTSRPGHKSKPTEFTSMSRDTRVGHRTAMVCAMPPPTSCPTMRGVVDRELIEEPNDALGMTSHRHIPTRRSIAPSVAEEVHDHDTVTLRNERNDIGPEVRRRWKSVEENDRLAGSATSGGVVVESRSVYVDELTPHEGSRREVSGRHRWHECIAMKIGFTRQDVPANALSQAKVLS